MSILWYIDAFLNAPTWKRRAYREQAAALEAEQREHKAVSERLNILMQIAEQKEAAKKDRITHSAEVRRIERDMYYQGYELNSIISRQAEEIKRLSYIEGVDYKFPSYYGDIGMEVRING